MSGLPSVFSLARLALTRHALSLTAAATTGFTLLVVGLVLSPAYPLATVAIVTMVGAVAALLVSLPVEGRLLRSRQLLAHAAHELSGRRLQALQSPSAMRDPMAMLTEGFNDALAQVEENLLGNAVQSSGEMIAIADLDGRFSFVNRAFVQAYGYSEEELLGRDLGLVGSDRNTPELLHSLGRETRRGGWHGELLTRRKDGTEFPISLRTSPIRDETGETIGLVGIGHDVTERQALEARLRQAQKMEAVGRLAGGVAHDFNNLLGVIQGYGALLQRQLDHGHPGRDKLDQMIKASERAANLTRQLLAFSRRQVLEPRVLELNAVVTESEPLLRRLVGEDVEVQVLEGASLGRVRADAGQIDQVLMNLVANARDAMPRGGRLLIETANVEWAEGAAPGRLPAPPGRYVRLSVRDTGTGIDAETLAHIFEPFFTTKERGKGTGLGLATVYGIVKQSGGYVGVDTEPGKGSSFDVYLPRVDDAVEPAKPAVAPAAVSGAKTILVVEDEDALREVAREVLESNGYRVLTASSGKEALSVAAAHPEPLRLLLTDVVMPGMSGQELADRLRAGRPEMSVLFMSGYSDDVVARRGTMGGEARLLTKPFSVATLAQSVHEVLEGDKVGTGSPIRGAGPRCSRAGAPTGPADPPGCRPAPGRPPGS
jgi:PAS domain S-box-containing protein